MSKWSLLLLVGGSSCPSYDVTILAQSPKQVANWNQEPTSLYIILQCCFPSVFFFGFLYNHSIFLFILANLYKLLFYFRFFQARVVRTDFLVCSSEPVLLLIIIMFKKWFEKLLGEELFAKEAIHKTGSFFFTIILCFFHLSS